MPYLCMSLYTANKRTYLSDQAAALYSPSAFYAAKVRARARACVRACLRVQVRAAGATSALCGWRGGGGNGSRSLNANMTCVPHPLPRCPTARCARAKVSATAPLSCLSAWVFSCIVYGMAGLRAEATAVCWQARPRQPSSR